MVSNRVKKWLGKSSKKPKDAPEDGENALKESKMPNLTNGKGKQPEMGYAGPVQMINGTAYIPMPSPYSTMNGSPSFKTRSRTSNRTGVVTNGRGQPPMLRLDTQVNGNGIMYGPPSSSSIQRPQPHYPMGAIPLMYPYGAGPNSPIMFPGPVSSPPPPTMNGAPRWSPVSTQHPQQSSDPIDNSVLAVSNVMKENEGKLAVGIDFGTTFAGVAFGSTRLFSGEIRQILSWPGSYETYRKVPSCILYEQDDPNEEARVASWGLEARNAIVHDGLIKCEWFKLYLSPEALRTGKPDPRLPRLPVGKDITDVISDYLRCIWNYAKGQITEQIGSIVDLDAADVVMTVPAAWDAAGCALMREAAIRAGLVHSSRAGDKNWRERLRIITEPEAAAIHASTLHTLHRLEPGRTFIVCDAGGGTVDCSAYKLLGQLSQLDIAELAVRTGANCGSLFIDLKFEELLRNTLRDHPTHLDAPSMAAFMHAFSETDKMEYHGTKDDDDVIFRFNCFNPDDAHDPSVGLVFGELEVPGHVLREQVFDPVIEQVLALIEVQLQRVPNEHVDALILVGGFGNSEYLFNRMRQAFGRRIEVIVRPQDCDIATLQGATRYGLNLVQGKDAVSSVICPRSYCMKCKLPAEPADRTHRPGFIRRNDAGIEICENRLSYLIAKGAVVKRGQRLRSRFTKFVRHANDHLFTAVLFSSDTDHIYRYTDEGDATELCRWTVDLATLPAFHYVVSAGGGFVEFDLGLELDSCEVRGSLMTDEGVEVGRATFDFL